MTKVSPLLLFAFLAAGASDRPGVSRGIQERAGHPLKPAAPSAADKGFSLPPGISLVPSLTEEAAVAIALWNNAALEADLASLGLARADLVQAGSLKNLNLQMLFPVGVKPFELLLLGPIEALWQRPRRVAAAEANLQQVAEGLVQNGLNLARDVRVAHTELALAERRTELAAEAARLRREIADLTQKRLRAGDISELEANLTEIDARLFQEQSTRFIRDVEGARERLRFLMGLRRDATPLTVASPPDASGQPPEWQALVETAASNRPDLRSAELAIQSALKRARWERSRILDLVNLGLSSKGIGDHGVKTGPGFAVDLPVFNRNEGPISRADAEVHRATFQYLALRDQIETEVREARLRLMQAAESLRYIRAEVLPAAEQSIRLAEKSYANGDVSYLSVLEASRQIYDIRSREADAEAALRRAAAQLDRGAGKRL